MWFLTRIKDLFDVCLNRAELLLNKKSGQVSLIQTVQGWKLRKLWGRIATRSEIFFAKQNKLKYLCWAFIYAVVWLRMPLTIGLNFWFAFWRQSALSRLFEYRERKITRRKWLKRVAVCFSEGQRKNIKNVGLIFFKDVTQFIEVQVAWVGDVGKQVEDFDRQRQFFYICFPDFDMLSDKGN